jgi:hypothetical protein
LGVGIALLDQLLQNFVGVQLRGAAFGGIVMDFSAADFPNGSP